MGEIPEKEMVSNWRNGQNKALQTATPVIIRKDKGIRLHCDTEGASIGYQILKKGQTATDKLTHKVLSYDFASIGGREGKNGDEFLSERPWTIYSSGQSITLSIGDTLVVKAKRIGYKESTLSYVEGVN